MSIAVNIPDARTTPHWRSLDACLNDLALHRASKAEANSTFYTPLRVVRVAVSGRRYR